MEKNKKDSIFPWIDKFNKLVKADKLDEEGGLQYSYATAVQHEYPIYSTQRTQSAVTMLFLLL